MLLVLTRRAQALRIHGLLGDNLLLALLLAFLVLVIVVLAWVGNLVLENLDELVEGDGEDCACAGTNPVDPVLLVPDAGDDAGPKGACGVERAACIVYADELADEEGEADTDGGDEGGYESC